MSAKNGVGAGRKTRHPRRNSKVIIIAAIGIAILGMGAVATISFSARPAQQSAMFGGLGSAHEHAEFVIKINGTEIDFSQPSYQVASLFIHIEGGVGTTLHKHATSVPVGEFLESIDMQVSDGCFVLDDGHQFCQTDENRLRFFVNGEERSASSISSYVLSDNDRFLIIYGNETEEQIGKELDQVSNIPLFRP